MTEEKKKEAMERGYYDYEDGDPLPWHELLWVKIRRFMTKWRI